MPFVLLSDTPPLQVLFPHTLADGDYPPRLSGRHLVVLLVVALLV